MKIWNANVLHTSQEQSTVVVIIFMTFHLTFTLGFQYCFSEKNLTTTTLAMQVISSKINSVFCSHYTSGTDCSKNELKRTGRAAIFSMMWVQFLPIKPNDSQRISSGECTLMKATLLKCIGESSTHCVLCPVFRPPLFWVTKMRKITVWLYTSHGFSS